jgi:phosphoglycerate dehydrogenase-like enzyme
MFATGRKHYRMPPAPRIAVAPGPPPEDALAAIDRAGGVLSPPEEADALLWLDWRDTEALKATLAANPGIRWIQLPWAGVEHYAAAGVLDPGRTWTCAKRIYGDEVAEHALALALALMRSLKQRSRATTWEREVSGLVGSSLYGARVTLLGAGGISAALLDQLRPFSVEATVVRRNPEPLAGAARTVGPDRIHDAIEGADLVVVALALTPETRGIIGRAEMVLMGPRCFLVNVARGAHVVTDDLVAALRNGEIAGAALDVTDPEPLPDGHPLWELDNCLITPHVANPVVGESNRRLLALFEDNLRRFAAGQQLVGLVDPSLGY